MPLGTIKEATGALQLYLVLHFIGNCQKLTIVKTIIQRVAIIIVIVGLDCIVNRV